MEIVRTTCNPNIEEDFKIVLLENIISNDENILIKQEDSNNLGEYIEKLSNI